MNPVDAVAELVRPHKLRIQLTPAVAYTVRAPCLLAQLEHALGLGSESGGRGVPSSRPLIAPEAWDLWVDVVTATYAWADHFGIDRAPYRRQTGVVVDPLDRRPPPERVPGWMTVLAGWVRPVAWADVPEVLAAPSGARRSVPAPEVPAARRLVPLPLDDGAPLADIPPVGRLLRAVAAEAIARGQDDVAKRIARSATSWARQTRTLLRQLEVEERVWPIRGQECGQCGATTAMESRHEDRCPEDCDAPRCRYRVPAIQVRLQPVPVGEDDEDSEEPALWPYWVCLACGDNAWVQPSGSEVR